MHRSHKTFYVTVESGMEWSYMVSWKTVGEVFSLPFH